MRHNKNYSNSNETLALRKGSNLPAIQIIFIWPYSLIVQIIMQVVVISLM